jgi:leucyl aminopeptidase
MKKKIIGILVCIILMLSSLGFVNAKPATEKDITSFDSEISIVKPNGIIIFNIQIISLPPQGQFGGIVIGKVDVEVDVGSSVNKVEFYVDNELKETDTIAPYSWTWDESMTFPPMHQLKVVGYDGDTEVGNDEIRVLYINPFSF